MKITKIIIFSYNENTNVVQGLANGSLLVVQQYNPKSDTITVRVKKNNQLFILTRLNARLEVYGRSKLKRQYFVQSTFPVNHVHAMTIHKGQGATIKQVHSFSICKNIKHFVLRFVFSTTLKT